MSVCICNYIILLSGKKKVLGNFFPFKTGIMEEHPQHLLLYLTAYLRDLGNSKCVYTNL